MRIGIINQRYGLEVNGGSELYSRQIAERLSMKYEVEVLTTCALDYVTWKNHYKEGSEDINNVKVRRFLVDKPRNPKVFSALDSEMHHNPNIKMEQAQKWVDEMGPYCPALVEYVQQNREDYDIFIIVTYLYYTAVRTMSKIADKTIFIPTAHQEPYIHFNLYKTVFQSPRAYIFLTDEEKELVHNIFHNEEIPYDVMGVGVDIPSEILSERFKKKYKLKNYIVYVGRIDQGKDCPRMFQYFMEYKKRNKNDIKLVLMGKAVMDVPKHKDIINLGFVNDEDKFDGIKGSRALLLPSRYESLSIAVLEAMSLGVPVIVNGLCNVLKGHCLKSNAGLYYTNYFEFEGILNYMIDNEDICNEMSKLAKAYIKRFFQWNDIMIKFDNMIKKILNNCQ